MPVVDFIQGLSFYDRLTGSEIFLHDFPGDAGLDNDGIHGFDLAGIVMAYGRILLDDLHRFYGNGTAFGLGSLAAAGKKQGCT